MLSNFKIWCFHVTANVTVSFSILQALLESGVDSEKSRSLVDFPTARDGQTAVHLAAENASESTDILAAVIQHSSNINAKDNLGEQVRDDRP